MNVALSAAELAAYNALRTYAAWFVSDGVWSAFRGDKAAGALNGLVTNDIGLLAVGASMHAAALTPKGKMVADMLIVRSEETTFLLHVSPAVALAWLELARKYVNPRLCKVTDESEHLRSWMVVGPRALEAIEPLTADASLKVFPAPSLGSIPALLLVAESASTVQVQERLTLSPIAPGSSNVWDIARIEAGRPTMGIDMDENTIPQEANLDTLGAISFSKGCYTGQETVARVHFRGHVNKHLRGLRGDRPLPRAADVTDAAGKVVGTVHSTALSPRMGAIALAMIRREVMVGDSVTVATDIGPISAQIVDLPFE